MKESDIRHADLYREFLRMAGNDAETFFGHARRITVPCPACSSDSHRPAFSKDGFAYVECASCATLFVNPRPEQQAFERFYRESPSARYFSDVFFPPVMEARREHIFRPRVKSITATCEAAGLSPRIVLDIGGGNGIFLEEWKRAHPGSHVCTIEPSERFADACRKKGIEVLQSVAENADSWAGRADLVTCFEVLEHVADARAFLKSLFNLVRPGGALLLTTLTVDGFDFQVLWERANAICPPLHIQFLSLSGFERLFASTGFIHTNITTPGQLDVDIVKNSIVEKGPDGIGRFEQTLLSRGESAMVEFQQFLVRHRLSSHCSVWARRPDPAPANT